MSGLDALKELIEMGYLEVEKGWQEDIVAIDDINIIEKELKRLEELEEEKQSFDKQLEKKLKALEIIKEKPQATLWLFQHCDKKMEYEDMISLFKEDITKEQFYLLKEVLL